MSGALSRRAVLSGSAFALTAAAVPAAQPGQDLIAAYRAAVAETGTALKAMGEAGGHGRYVRAAQAENDAGAAVLSSLLTTAPQVVGIYTPIDDDGELGQRRAVYAA